MGLLTQHIETDCLMNTALQCLVGALAGIDHTVHFLTDVQLEFQRRDCAAPESWLRCVINACKREESTKKNGRDFDLNWTSTAGWVGYATAWLDGCLSQALAGNQTGCCRGNAFK